MDELELYKKMYAQVVGQADDTIQMIAATVFGGGSCGRKKLLEVAEKLRQALLNAEELYLSAEDEAE